MAKTYFEDFNGANKAGVGYLNTWVEWEGTAWDNNNNQARATGIGGFANQTVRLDSAVDTDNQRGECTLAAFTDGGGSFFYGVQLYICGGNDSAGTYLSIQARPTAWRMYISIAEAFTQLGSDYVATPTANDVMRIERNGTAVEAFINNVSRITATLNGTQESALAGRRFGGLRWQAHLSGDLARIDNFTFEDYDQTPPLIMPLELLRRRPNMLVRR